MNKFTALCITALTILIIIPGCEPQPVAPTTPPKAEPAQPTPVKPTPPKAKLQKPKTPKTVFLHDKYADILNNFVNEKGAVDYKTLKRNKPKLKAILDQLAKLNPDEYNSWQKEEKIAFWINAYNIQLLKIITTNHPIKASRIRLVFWPADSIRHIQGIWDKYKFIVMNEEFTLAEIENRLFRKEFDEPRIFFAISQATLSSPTLRNEPYHPDTLYKQLDDQTKKFLKRTDAFKIDRQNKLVRLSAILTPDWFGKEFVSKYGTDKKFKDQIPQVRAVLNFATNYIPQHDISFLEVQNYSVKFINYNWILNE